MHLPSGVSEMGVNIRDYTIIQLSKTLRIIV